MKKSTKYIILGIVGLGIIGQFLPEAKPSKPLNHKIVKSFEDISKQFYHCEFLLNLDEVKAFTKDELKERMAKISNQEACGESGFYLNENAIKANFNSNIADENPEFLNDYIGKFNKKKNEFAFNSAFLDSYKIN